MSFISPPAHRFRELELEQSRAVDLISPKVAERIGNSGTPKAGTSLVASRFCLIAVSEL